MEEYLGIPEAAERLGLHEETVRRHLRAGRLPGRRLGRKWRIPAGALAEFVAAQEDAPPPRRPDLTAGGVLDLVQALRSDAERNPEPHRAPGPMRDLRFALRILRRLESDLSKAPEKQP